MTDMEQRVRRELAELVDSVPASAHPRGDFERRLAVRRKDRWRAPVLATAAAAAVVVTAVAIPVAMSDSGAGNAGPAATTTLPPSSGSDLPPRDKVELATVVDQGVEHRVTLAADAGKWCLALPHIPEALTECYSLGPWPQAHPQGGPGSWVMSRLVLEAEGRPDLMLFIAAPTVTRLEVGDAAGAPVLVRQVAETSTGRYFLAEFPESHHGFRYTAYDAQGNVVESAIT